jgi:hypothetical protein
MTDKDRHATGSQSSTSTLNLVGFYSAILTTILTIVTFGFAMATTPISGANCPGGCVDYPYLDTISEYPKGFLWMLPAMLLVLGYVTLIE